MAPGSSDTRRKVWGITALCIVLALLPWVVNPFRVRVFTLTGIYTIAVTGLTLFMGFTGQISLAQAAFFGIGAYTSGILTIAGFPFPLAFVCAGVIAALFGLLIGLPCLRARGFYLAMATLGFMLSITILFKNVTGLTGGVSGLGGIPPASIGPVSFEGFIPYYYLTWTVVAVVLYLARRLTTSYSGLTFRAIANNELAAESLGMNAYMNRLLSFLICAFLAGIAGSLYAHLDRVIAPESFTFEEAVIFLTMAVIGGLTSIYGGLIGAVVFTVIGEQLRSFERGQVIIVGAILIVMVIFFPRGAVSLPRTIADLMRRVRHNRKPSAS
jgi:branched-chain amino acid transport system permease protein